ncbi:putative cytochrome c biosynthesis protein [Morus notabilis]|uniref:Putative cytochrome c biosynthesis protein n=1 Tax=Morus notabilis TaxID=981085 RepID=W9QTD3_9ROSA|nr:putative cytochrome c biosynthesis protein [Morus notabilis]
MIPGEDIQILLEEALNFQEGVFWKQEGSEVSGYGVLEGQALKRRTGTSGISADQEREMSSDHFVRNFLVRTEPLAESNPVPQDPISAIHPPCIYAGAVASAMAFGLCRSKMMNGIVALHSPPMRKDAAEKNGTLLCCSTGCVGS